MFIKGAESGMLDVRIPELGLGSIALNALSAVAYSVSECILEMEQLTFYKISTE